MSFLIFPDPSILKPIASVFQADLRSVITQTALAAKDNEIEVFAFNSIPKFLQEQARFFIISNISTAFSFIFKCIVHKLDG